MTIRKPKLSEIAAVKKLLDMAAATGALLPRPIMELYESARDFFVYIEDGAVGGCVALHIDALDLAEIRSLVVREDLRRKGAGAKLVEACLVDARQLEIGRVYTLTRIPSYFEKQGFHVVDKHDLPHKVYNDCVRCPLFPDCDEVAMVRDSSMNLANDAGKRS